jgi:hypothetical protein
MSRASFPMAGAPPKRAGSAVDVKMPIRCAPIIRIFIAMACMATGASYPTHAQETTPPRTSSLSPADSARVNPLADLRPTTAPPWNPPQAESGLRLWESLLQLPGRIVTLPVSALGYGTRNYLLFVERHYVVPRAIAMLASLPRIGGYVIPASLGDHTGTGVALVARPLQLHGILGGELSASTQHYHRTRVQLALGPFGADYLYEWRPRDQFFGLGPDSRQADLSEFAVQDQSIRAHLEVPARHLKQPAPRAQMSAYVGTRQLVMRHGRGQEPSFEEVFPVIGASQLDGQAENVFSGVRGYLDTRNGEPHWTHGVRLEAQVDYYGGSTTKALAFETASSDAPEFTRYHGGVVTGFSFMRDPRTIRLSLRGSHQDVAHGSGAMRIYDLAGLGGSRGLYGFEPGRFYDLDMVVGELSYIFPLAQHFELDLHTELGNVYRNVLEAPTWCSLRQSYGVQLRPRTDSSPLGFVGVDWSNEGIRFRFSIGGVE